MTAGNIVYARFPIELDSSADADTALITPFANFKFLPITAFVHINTNIVFDSGTKTKGTVIITAQDLT